MVWLAGATVAAQIAYPLSGGAKSSLTVVIVVMFFLTSVTACAHRHGPRAGAALVVLAAGGGYAAEAIGVHTGFPFGTYSYAGTLGPELFDVPLVIGMAWAMMAYPALEVARTLAPRHVPLVGGAALATWDLFLDPQMVDAGHWSWAYPTPSLPGIEGIPLTNFLGWAVVAVVLLGLLDRAIPHEDRAESAATKSVSGLLYLWTYVSSVLASAVFFDRPLVALVGGIGMGAIAVPYARALLRSAR